jgi:steroid delta-isomerase-like uncharacterized protein
MASSSRARRHVVSTEENKALVRRYVEAIHKGNMDEGEGLLAPDFAFHVSGAPGPLNSEAFRQLFAGLLTAFPDLAVTNEDLIAEGDKVAGRWITRGTHQDELWGIPPTGKQVKITSMDVNHLTGGKIAERWHEYDALGMMQQLGVIPVPDSPVGEPGGDGASGTTKKASPTSPEENKALVRRYWQEASRRGLLAVMEEFLAPDVVSHPPASASPEPVRGLDAFKQFIAGQFGAFPDMAVTVEDLIAEGDRVAARVTTRGTHEGELMGLPPTGRRVEWSGISMTRHANGRIVEQWGEFDAMGLLQQLSGDALSEPGSNGGFTVTPEEAGRQYER